MISVTQGGDWGSAVRYNTLCAIHVVTSHHFQITQVISQTYGGKYAKAWHTNCPLYAVVFRSVRTTDTNYDCIVLRSLRPSGLLLGCSADS